MTKTKTYTILLASFALILAIGVCAPQALAEDGPHLNVLTIAHNPVRAGAAAPQAVPEAASVPLILQGMSTIGPSPSTYGPPPSWPCFPTAAPCSSDPAGGYLAAIPTEVFSLSACESAPNSTTGIGGCGELWWTFEVSASLTCPTAGCPLSVGITAVQGTTTVYSLPLTNIGTVPSGKTEGGAYTEVIYGSQGLGLNWGAASNPTSTGGPVAFTVTTQVTSGTTTTKTVTATGKFSITI
jgi:hypothetical protein